MSSPRTYAIVSGVLPPAVAALFSFSLPRLMRRLSKYMGANSHTMLDRVVIARYFTFMIISQLIIFTVIGVIYSKSSFCGWVSLTDYHGCVDAILELIAILRIQKVTITVVWDNLNSKLTSMFHSRCN